MCGEKKVKSSLGGYLQTQEVILVQPHKKNTFINRCSTRDGCPNHWIPNETADLLFGDADQK